LLKVNYDSLGLELPKADNLYNLELIYKQKKKYETALRYFREAYEIYLKQGDKNWAKATEDSIQKLETLEDD
jgi:tetratricopeptide (TPR) repeat protein